jgi:hypothetical protein
MNCVLINVTFKLFSHCLFGFSSSFKLEQIYVFVLPLVHMKEVMTLLQNICLCQFNVGALDLYRLHVTAYIQSSRPCIALV